MCSGIKTLHVYDTELNADCVAWCPHPGKEHLLVCTTYQLLTPEETKVGAILLFAATSETLQLKQHIKELPGILDAKWAPKNWSTSLLATADSQGNILIYTLDDASEKLVNLTSYRVFPDSSPSPLALYLDWSPHDCNNRGF